MTLSQNTKCVQRCNCNSDANWFCGHHYVCLKSISISRKMRLLLANFLITSASIWISFFRLNQHIFRKMRLILANLLITLASADVFTDPAIFERLCHFKNDGVVSCHKIKLFIDSIKSEIMNCRWTISTPWTRQWLPMPAAVLLLVRILRFWLDNDGRSLPI